jgi:hypothetical protein
MNWEENTGRFSLFYNALNETYTMKDLSTKEEVTTSKEKVDNFIMQRCGDKLRPRTHRDMLDFLIIQS